MLDAGFVFLTPLAGLFALAAMQPVLELGRERAEREDAELYVVFDTSRSMLAAAAPGEPNRLARAEELALRLRARIPLVPVGIASFRLLGTNTSRPPSSGLMKP